MTLVASNGWRASAPWDKAYRSGEYLLNWEYSQPSQELVASIANLGLPRGSVALDVGCGAGREAIFLASCGYRVYAADFSREALRIGRRRSTKARVSVQWCHTQVTNLPVPDHVVDFVNDRGCFHLISEHNRRRFARELARVMRSGGHILLRGSKRRGPQRFVPVTRRSVERAFERSLFSLESMLPVTMMADSGALSANLVVLTRK